MDRTGKHRHPRRRARATALFQTRPVHTQPQLPHAPLKGRPLPHS